ncbi:hypothetical protein CYMTET_34470 [Cymbomonas tetramitiformis]|uniref:Uncharacterized protein n=1 Tax=Cymbomonas tetramitiformis TaxID=36881 RepID=A0AAE0FB90_9CHLO|nr:hypothetical protein CYMTET_34470 [Cymbomonas tetramitiformis]
MCSFHSGCRLLDPQSLVVHELRRLPWFRRTSNLSYSRNVRSSFRDSLYGYLVQRLVMYCDVRRRALAQGLHEHHALHLRFAVLRDAVATIFHKTFTSQCCTPSWRHVLLFDERHGVSRALQSQVSKSLGYEAKQASLLNIADL